MSAIASEEKMLQSTVLGWLKLSFMKLCVNVEPIMPSPKCIAPASKVTSKFAIVAISSAVLISGCEDEMFGDEILPLSRTVFSNEDEEKELMSVLLSGMVFAHEEDGKGLICDRL
ncbi:hypothetical protein LTR16_012454, partial [Cryomyces antarcticus]